MGSALFDVKALLSGALGFGAADFRDSKVSFQDHRFLIKLQISLQKFPQILNHLLWLRLLPLTLFCPTPCPSQMTKNTVSFISDHTSETSNQQPAEA